jgi:hypothetical protein
METQDTKNEKERITLEYTAKGFANWTISVKEDIISTTTIERLGNLDEQMRARFTNNVMGQTE